MLIGEDVRAVPLTELTLDPMKRTSSSPLLIAPPHRSSASPPLIAPPRHCTQLSSSDRIAELEQDLAAVQAAEKVCAPEGSE